MALDSPKKPFSKRHGYSQPKEIGVWEDAPEPLRHFVLDTALEMGVAPSPLRDIVCGVVRVRPNPGNWSEYPNIWSEVEEHVYGCEWFKFYDFLEKLYAFIAKPASNIRIDLVRQAAKKATEFQEAVN